MQHCLIGGSLSSVSAVFIRTIVQLCSNHLIQHKALIDLAYSQRTYRAHGLLSNMSSWGPDRIDLLLTGSDNGIYHKNWGGRSWVPGTTNFDKPISGTWVGNPVYISRQPNTVDALAVSTNGKLYHIAYDTKSGWNEPVSLGGEWIGPPCAVKQSKDRFDVLMVGLAGGLYHKVFDGGFKPSADAEWKSLGGNWRQELSAVSKGTATTSVYGLGMDNAVWEAKWNDQPSDKFSSLVMKPSSEVRIRDS